MKLSRPTTVRAFVAIPFAGAAWYAPPRHPASQAAVMLPAATYDLLVVKGKSPTTADGRPRTAAQVIEIFVGQ